MIRTVTDVEECRALWEAFAAGERVWDEWDIVSAYHDQRQYDLQFLVHEAGGKADGMVPMVHDQKDDSFELYGGCYPENRPLWVRPGDFPEFFEHFPPQTVFFDLNGDCVRTILADHPQYLPNFREQDQRYFLVPETFQYDFGNHINTFSGDKRSGFLYDLRKIRQLNPVIHWSDDDEADLFIRLSNQNFGAESDYIAESGQDELKRVVHAFQAGGYLRTITISINGNKEAVAFCVLYKGTMVVAYSSSNNSFKNLGKLLNVETIQEGCRLRVNEINYMTGMQWKANWKMNSEICYTMRKPPKPEAETAAAGQVLTGPIREELQ